MKHVSSGRSSEPRHPLLAAHSLLMLAFVYVPVLIVMAYSFNDTRLNAVWQGWTWKWYTSLLTNDRIMEALANSLTIALVSTVISTILGTIAALALRGAVTRSKQKYMGLLYLPIIVPDIIMGLSLLLLFSQLHIPLGKGTVIAAHITFSISYVYVVVAARLTGMGRDLEEAAQDLGATPWQSFRYIMLPAILPGVIAGAIIAFTLSLDDFIISFFVTGPNSTTLPIYIYGQVKRGISPEINALSTLMVVVTVLLVILAEWLRSLGMKQRKGRSPEGTDSRDNDSQRPIVSQFPL